ELNVWASMEERDQVRRLGGEQSGQIAVKLRKMNGQLRDVLFHAKLIHRDGQACLLTHVQDVTDRMAVEESLRTSRERLKLMFRVGPLPSVLLRQSDHRLMDVNLAFEAATGYSRQEAIGRSVLKLELWDEVDEQKFGQQLQKEGGRLHGYPSSFRTRSGQIRDVLVFAEAFDFDDEPCLLAQFQDVTEENRAHELAAESAERFETAFEANPTPKLISTLDTGQIVAVNAAFCETFGYRRNELIGGFTADTNLWRDREERQAITGLLQEEGSIRSYPRHVRTRTGESRDVLMWVQPIVLDGRAHTLSLYVDVTEFNRLQQDVKLRAVALANAGEAISIADADGRILFVNNAFTRDTGYTQDEVSGRTTAELLHGPSQGRAEELDQAMVVNFEDQDIQNALETVGHWEGESWFRRKNGEIYPRLLNLGVVRDDRGNITHCISV